MSCICIKSILGEQTVMHVNSGYLYGFTGMCQQHDCSQQYEMYNAVLFLFVIQLYASIYRPLKPEMVAAVSFQVQQKVKEKVCGKKKSTLFIWYSIFMDVYVVLDLLTFQTLPSQLTSCNRWWLSFFLSLKNKIKRSPDLTCMSV